MGWGVITSDQTADSRTATLTMGWGGVGGVGWGVITSDQTADSRTTNCRSFKIRVSKPWRNFTIRVSIS